MTVHRLDAIRPEFFREFPWKVTARACSTSNINVASPGATIDGVTMAVGDRWLGIGQTAGAENGLRVWLGAAVASPRSEHMCTGLDALGSVTVVLEGTANGGKVFKNTNVGPITIDTTVLTFANLGASLSLALDDLTDVTITSATTADRLRFDGSVWRNSALIWTPLTVYDPTTTNYLPLVDGSGNQIMAEA